MSDLAPYVLLLLFSVFISSVSQILLKKAAQKTYPNKIREYLNPYVVIAYSIFLLSTVLTMLALRRVPLSMQPILESTSYIYVSVLGYVLLKEPFSKRKAAGILVILLGILVYSLKF
ncbi:MAG: EamA family transporter [Eubacteriales bacterium]|nr:EamA family transporter [Eubacteriales bacterium]